MNITFKNKPMTLEGTLIKVGEKLSFKATNVDFSEFNIEDIKGEKVISVFPSIDTSVCDAQTLKIKDLAEKYKDKNFISISLDLPSAQQRWCGAKGIENLQIVSDYKEREFGKKSGLIIYELKLLHRALIVLDENNVVSHVIANNEVTDAPNFEKLESIL